MDDDTIAWYENDGAANPGWTASADIDTMLMVHGRLHQEIWIKMAI